MYKSSSSSNNAPAEHVSRKKVRKKHQGERKRVQRRSSPSGLATKGMRRGIASRTI